MLLSFGLQMKSDKWLWAKIIPGFSTTLSMKSVPGPVRVVGTLRRHFERRSPVPESRARDRRLWPQFLAAGQRTVSRQELPDGGQGHARELLPCFCRSVNQQQVKVWDFDHLGQRRSGATCDEILPCNSILTQLGRVM